MGSACQEKIFYHRSKNPMQRKHDPNKHASGDDMNSCQWQIIFDNTPT